VCSSDLAAIERTIARLQESSIHSVREVNLSGLPQKPFRGNITRAAVELAKDWRQDRYLRRLEALLIVGDTEHLFVLSGTGDVVEPDDNIAAIGSGGPYAQAAALALIKNTAMSAEAIVREALQVAGRIDIYTNDDIAIETL
jgi:ATP-dependent HslUV protease subunit HslV